MTQAREHEGTFVIPCGYCQIEFKIAAWEHRKGRKYCSRGCAGRAAGARSREKKA